VIAAAGLAVMAMAGGGWLSGGRDGGGGLSSGGEGSSGEGGGGDGGGGLIGGNEGGGGDVEGGVVKGAAPSSSICPSTPSSSCGNSHPSCGSSSSSVISKPCVPRSGARTTGGAQQRERGALASSSRLASARRCRSRLCHSVLELSAACCLGLRLCGVPVFPLGMRSREAASRHAPQDFFFKATRFGS
jgi:hypothetical protein